MADSEKELEGYVGARGCAGNTKRGGRLRKCAQQWVVIGSDGKTYCYYHNIDDPHKFGEGYYYIEQMKAGRYSPAPSVSRTDGREGG